ncbi:MAG TPA: glycine--tRNA ligase [Candidatus Poseidoniales archaeon]|nr:MAG: glycine--tRNA ligase [Euryarchaeota archaeon]HIA24253.1 glycine--tRNA ligase [Candidatus Poseidoniales archaeon]PXY75839.1 MAG: glycine--tRNA ligase [Euryarchaeota archaeon]PXY79884.1 MAG: glycine--tRNA ligase [Euryarchaeota archaeon]HIB24100.1 glycine--tRNA ligase [Candidatus Poseidoniales archaeon]
MTSDSDRVNSLMSMLKRRGIIFPAFSIHGGIAGLYDYGPVGGRLLRKVQQQWREHWLSKGNIVEIDSPTITPESVLQASGHVSAFNDHASECNSCNAIFRSDHLVEEFHQNADSLSGPELDSILSENSISCPSCKNVDWANSRPMNLMFGTKIGATRGGRQAYMRPETAQGMFLTFPMIQRHFRNRLPYGAIQVGKGYRNEISPRQGMIRQREFNMAELEYFIDPNVDAHHDLSKWNGINFQLIPDPENGEQKNINMDISTALEQNIVRHPTVAMFMAETYDFLTNIGADPEKIRFRQHESDEMAHYASDCWDLEMHGSYGWVECVGIAHRGCYDLEAHENATNSNELRAWRDFDEPIEVDKEVVSAIGSIVGPAFRQRAGQVTQALAELENIPTSFPFELSLSDGSNVTIDDSMVKVVRVQETIRGEWFLPHVVEPAFGLDRIIWHLLDHGYEMTSKEGEEYLILHLSESVAPYEVVVLPLFEKDGMGQIGKELQTTLLQINGIGVYYDGTRSIGRRYARADEIGVPWAVTIDYESLEDGSVTVRRRDDQSQIRISTDDLIQHLQSGSLASVF